MTQIRLALLIATVIFGAAEWTHGDEPGENRPISIRELRENFNTQAMLDIPTSPIDERVLEQWRSILNASDAQMRFILAEYARYVEQYNDLVQALGPHLWAAASKLEERVLNKGAASPTPATYRLANQLDGLCRDFRHQTIAIEQAFINAIRPALTKEQLGQLRTVEHESRRRNCRTFHSTVRWSDVELRPIWQHAAAELASPRERQLVNAILDEYEESLTTLVCRCARQSIEGRREYAQQFEALQHGRMAFQDFAAAAERIYKRRLDTLQRIQQVNEHAFGQIVDVISERAAAALNKACRRAVFPEVYPDPSGLHELLSTIVEDQHDEEVRDHLLQLLSSYKRQQSDINRKLEEICVEWGNMYELDRQGYEPQYLTRALEPKFEERRDLAQRYLSSVFEYLGPERMEPYAFMAPIPLKETIQEWLESAMPNGQ